MRPTHREMTNALLETAEILRGLLDRETAFELSKNQKDVLKISKASLEYYLDAQEEPAVYIEYDLIFEEIDDTVKLRFDADNGFVDELRETLEEIIDSELGVIKYTEPSGEMNVLERVTEFFSFLQNRMHRSRCTA